jgi:hypothetical protein
MRIRPAGESELAEPSLLRSNVAGPVECRKHVYDPDARPRGRASDRRVDRSVERCGLPESIGLRVPGSGHDDVGSRRRGPKLPKDRAEARSERRDQLGKAVYSAAVTFWASVAEAPDSPASWTPD